MSYYGGRHISMSYKCMSVVGFFRVVFCVIALCNADWCKSVTLVCGRGYPSTPTPTPKPHTHRHSRSIAVNDEHAMIIIAASVSLGLGWTQLPPKLVVDLWYFWPQATKDLGVLLQTVAWYAFWLTLHALALPNSGDG